MLFNVEYSQQRIVDAVTVAQSYESHEVESRISFSASEKDMMNKGAQVIERLHSMDGERMGWLSILLDKATLLMNAATEWQKAKLEREKVALELAKIKMRGQD